MKKTLVVVVAIAIGLCASVSSAQIPNVVVYFDNTYTQQSALCPQVPAGTVFDELYVVANNFNMWMSAIEYTVELPPSLMFLGDIIDEDTQLKIGSAVTGIGISWPLPANAFGALRCQKLSVLWQCQNLGGLGGPPPDTAPQCVLADGVTGFTDHTINVLPYPSSGLVRAVRWPDNVVVVGVGLTSVICGSTIPVEETTWGGIKALYDE